MTERRRQRADQDPIVDYQQRLTERFTQYKLKFPNTRPIDVTIEQAKRVFGTRPLWTHKFIHKGIRVPNNTEFNGFYVGILQSPSTINEYSVERELIKDELGKPMLVERVLDAGGTLTRLSILDHLEGTRFLFREEVRKNRMTFDSNGPYEIGEAMDLEKLLISGDKLSLRLSQKLLL